MKAVFCTGYGSPAVLQLRETEKPVPKENEILVRIFSTCVNSGDVVVRGLAVKGFMKIVMRLVIGFTRPRKPILGTVFSGTVERIGGNVTGFMPGDSIFGMTGFRFGTHAEYLTINENGSVIKMPDGATYDEAASWVFGGHTAIHFFDKMKLAQSPGARILILGATGAVGAAAIQIAQYYGLTVTAVCSSAGRDLVESLGITDILLYDRENYLNQSRQFDFIFDAVGKTTRKQCAPLLKKGGIYQSVAGMESASESKHQLELLKTMFEKGQLKSVIDKTYRLDEMVAAHTYVDTGRKKGNVVIRVVE